MTEEKTITVQQALATPVPDEFVSQRSGLSYITGRYVKQRLNELFGPLGWSYTVEDVRLDPENVAAFVHVRLTVTVFGEEKVTVTKDGLAYGFAAGRKGPEAYDFAIAEGVTDALKRAAVALGQNLGLSLYPLTSGAAPKKSAPKPKSKPAKPKAAPKPTVDTEDGDDW